MPPTTIKLDSEVRDRLAKLAAEHGRSLGEQIAALLEEREMIRSLRAGARLFQSLSPEHQAALRPPARTA
jgi:macrodomain Ter protein organizer (MatP/YcbG family)